MIYREASQTLREIAKEFPAVAITGPRQSGKTTLAKEIFNDRPYVSLEDLDQYEFALEDPRGFLDNFPNGVVLDEVQRCPKLFNYLQGVLDRSKKNGLFILTGSSQFTLNDSISQSLAGRVGQLSLLPFSVSELRDTPHNEANFNKAIFRGYYPRVVSGKASPHKWLNAYLNTYVEKDIRQILNISNRDAFLKFLSLCAGNVGSLLNLQRIATDCSISANTAKSWLSILSTSYICFTLQPHHSNFRKRLVKTPKLYFYDTGLATRLLGLQQPEQLDLHPMKGNLFENLIISDMMKSRFNKGLDPSLYFWRDHGGLEVDVIFDDGIKLHPLEIKSGKTISSNWFESLKKWQKISGDSSGPLSLIYGGDQSRVQSEVQITGWTDGFKWLS